MSLNIIVHAHLDRIVNLAVDGIPGRSKIVAPARASTAWAWTVDIDRAQTVIVTAALAGEHLTFKVRGLTVGPVWYGRSDIDIAALLSSAIATAALPVFFDTHGGAWTVCAADHGNAEAFGPAGAARCLSPLEIARLGLDGAASAWSAANNAGRVVRGTDGGFDVLA